MSCQSSGTAASQSSGSARNPAEAELRLLDMDGRLPQTRGYRSQRLSIPVPVADGKRKAPNGQVIRAVFDFTTFTDQLEFYYAPDRHVQAGLLRIRYDNFYAVKLYTRENIEIIVHRQILIAGSLYFDSALRGFFREADTAEISLDDISFDDLIAYLKLAHRYFFLRFSEEGMPSGNLWKAQVERYDRKVFRRTCFKMPLMDLCSILRIFVLADRFASSSLVVFVRQIFLKLLAATRDFWFDNKHANADYEREEHHAFMNNYLDAYQLLTKYACADVKGYLKNSIMESWVKFLGYNEGLKYAMKRKISANGDRYSAFETAWTKLTMPGAFRLFESDDYIGYNEDEYLRNRAFTAACLTHCTIEHRNALFAQLKRRALKHRLRAQVEQRPFPGEITWTSVVRLAAGDSIRVINEEPLIPSAVDSDLSHAMKTLTMEDEATSDRVCDHITHRDGSNVIFDLPNIDNVKLTLSDSEDSDDSHTTQSDTTDDGEWVSYVPQPYMSHSRILASAIDKAESNRGSAQSAGRGGNSTDGKLPRNDVSGGHLKARKPSNGKELELDSDSPYAPINDPDYLCEAEKQRIKGKAKEIFQPIVSVWVRKSFKGQQRLGGAHVRTAPSGRRYGKNAKIFELLHEYRQ
ncbi:hypothetical protein D7B24_007253 [Verticillium nonalfalfae]|uniref:BTB domain-containing protein n=1 Tax=Verticillium nonalfalfae TaxID=1051616 RepID=A0A3M9Y7F5_9PEZI|nr:uncharacterized protein D7B24_007253 [Verticillium nonalfalfae]RNJ56417.1 hypothetical protein D7B24_007253 [Verticillium nonalfalfae]